MAQFRSASANEETPETDPARAQGPRPETDWPGPGLRETLVAVREHGANYLSLIESFRRRYGDAFRFRLGAIAFHVVTEPGDVAAVLKAPRDVFPKNPLITREMRSLGPESVAVTEGETWKAHRVRMAPPFRPQSLPRHTDAIGLALEAWRARWASLDDPARRAEEDAADFAFDVMMRLMLGAPMPALERRLRAALETEIDCLTRRVASPLPMPHWAPTPNQNRLRQAQSELDAAVREILARAEERGAAGFAAAWLQAYRAGEADPGVARETVRDQLMSILTAGHQTASFGLAYCLHSLAAHPEVAHRVAREADAVLAGRAPTAGDLERLPVARNVVRETLRIHPVLPVVVRKAARDFELPARRIPRGANVAISLWSAHRHPDHWPEPERFDPDRFTPAASAGRHPGAWVPFSLGARNCLAGDFAVAELQSAIAYLSQFFRLELDPESKLDVEPRLALAPRDGVRIRVHPRD